MGSVASGETLMMVPTLTRNVTSLLLLGGQVGGAHSDQNSILLDSGNVTN